MPTFRQNLDSLKQQAAEASTRSPDDARMDMGRIRDYQQLADDIAELQSLLKNAQAWEIARQAFNAGYLAHRAEIRHLSPELHAGLAVKSGGRKGAARAHGNAETRRKRYEGYQELYAQLRTKRPRDGHVKLTDAVADHFEVSGRTVRKVVKRAT